MQHVACELCPVTYQYDKSSLFTIFSVLFPVGVSNIFNNREVTRYSRNNRTFLSVSLIIFRIKSLHVFKLIDLLFWDLRRIGIDNIPAMQRRQIFG